MPRLNHVNIRAHSLDETVAFYRNVLGMTARTPPGFDPSIVQWMCDEDGAAILHLVQAGARLKDDLIATPSDAPGTGVIDHVALECSQHETMIATLERHGLAYRLNHVASVDLRQVFVKDPNGVQLELNFRGG